jgi:O-antigen/teichoic acid export membrane protein
LKRSSALLPGPGLSIARGRVATHLRTPLYGSAYALVLSAGATSALGVVYWTLAARLYHPDELGINAAAISAMVFISYLAQLNLGPVLSRFVPTSRSGTRRLVAGAYAVTVVLSLLAAGVFLLGIDIWAPRASDIKLFPGLAVWFVVATACWSLFAVQDGVLTGLRQTKWVPLENTLFSLAKIALLAVLAVLMPTFGIFASWTIPAAIAIVPVNVLIFRRLIPDHVDGQPVSREGPRPAHLVRYLTGDYLGSLFVTGSTALLPLLVLSVQGSAGTAYFFVAWTIAYTLQLLSLNVATALMVEATADQDPSQHLRRAVRLLAALQLPAIAGIVVLAPPILGIFGGDYEDRAANLLRLLAIAAVPHAINALFLGVARARGTIRSVVVVQAVLFGLVIGLSVLLLPRFGIEGIGFAWLAAHSVVALVVAPTQLVPLLRGHRAVTITGRGGLDA